MKVKHKSFLNKLVHDYFHIGKHQSLAQKALENVYNILTSNELLGIRSLK